MSGSGNADAGTPNKTGLLRTLNQLFTTLQSSPHVTEDVADNVNEAIRNAGNLALEQNGDFSSRSAMPIEMAANAALRSLRKSQGNVGDPAAAYLSADVIDEMRTKIRNTIDSLESSRPPRPSSQPMSSNSTIPNTLLSRQPVRPPKSGTSATAASAATSGAAAASPALGSGSPGSTAPSHAIAVNSALNSAFAVGDNAIAVGDNAIACGQQATAIGARAIVTGTGSTAVGAGAIAAASDSIALGSGSVTNRDGTVSIGRNGHERQIVHVAPGTEPTDAVNVTQLRAAMSNANAYTNRRIGDLQQSITDTARDAYSGVAAATALTMIPDVDRDKVLSIGVGGAVYKGHRAVALGGTARISENLKVRAGVAMSAGGNTVGVGMSWQW